MWRVEWTDQKTGKRRAREFALEATARIVYRAWAGYDERRAHLPFVTPAEPTITEV